MTDAVLTGATSEPGAKLRRPDLSESRIRRRYAAERRFRLSLHSRMVLGTTALLGAGFRLTQHRHELIENRWAPWLLATRLDSLVPESGCSTASARRSSS